ncbi:unnamed protein product, partial [Ectocarpus sp. 12 AP-2014]
RGIDPLAEPRPTPGTGGAGRGGHRHGMQDRTPSFHRTLHTQQAITPPPPPPGHPASSKRKIPNKTCRSHQYNIFSPEATSLPT